jgi:23S rRNA (cytosine1962-C5)-methyltransferase
MKPALLITKSSTGYELLDSGREEKLERYGSVVLSRPDPQALWEKNLREKEWKKADGWYERKGNNGVWHTKANFQKEWTIEFGGLNFLIRPTSFKHTGLFPEQLSNWNWISEKLKPETGHLKPKVLNLFAYTGGATLAAAKAGAEVTHVDASKTVVAWARENAALSDVAEKPIRWVVEDVMLFVRRELKRGNKYDAIIMDPPAFGHGPKDELWKIEDDFLTLIKMCRELLSDTPLFFLISGYAAGYSSLAFAHNLEPLIEKFGGNIEGGELTIEESKTARLLPAGIFARWSI